MTWTQLTLRPHFFTSYSNITRYSLRLGQLRKIPVGDQIRIGQLRNEIFRLQVWLGYPKQKWVQGHSGQNMHIYIFQIIFCYVHEMNVLYSLFMLCTIYFETFSNNEEGPSLFFFFNENIESCCYSNHATRKICITVCFWAGRNATHCLHFITSITH